MSPQERLLKQQQLQEQQKQAATATSRQRQPSSPGGDMEAQSEDDDLVDFLEGQMMEVDPSNSAVKPKGPISLNAFTETVAGGRVDHDDEGDITSSDED
ncbi:hypothetical protein BGZ97_013055 [Linnemannia gamsii]|uniref:Uncharacterized protein n=1 Tax=Linnemannia gamsii TaxID=64522 RepID=A0A9P6R061_9FUNG|nr:hypothetical protein BGZ97_013055 [Linnemannia gamsii]